MKRCLTELQIFITLALFIHNSMCCETCESNLNQVQCNQGRYCTWSNNQCSSLTKCSQLNSTQCTLPSNYLMSLETCNLINGTCAPVTCSSLSPQNLQDCYNNNCNYNGSKCTVYEFSDVYSSLSSQTCQNVTNTSALPSGIQCKYFTNSTTNTLCYLNATGSNCVQTSFQRDCSVYNTSDACKQVPFCTYISDTCVQTTCSKLSANESYPKCHGYFDNQGNYQHCEVVNGLCTNLPLSNLNQTQCESPTTQTTWTGSTCQLCSDYSNLGNQIRTTLGLSSSSQTISMVIISVLFALLSY